MNEEGRPPGGQPQHQLHTASKYRGRVGDRVPVLPRGELHPYSRCAFCNADSDLRPAVMVTLAEAMVCEDTIACRRRSQKRLEGRAA